MISGIVKFIAILLAVYEANIPVALETSTVVVNEVVETQDIDINDDFSIVFKASTENPTEEDMDTVVSILRTRLDGMGYTEATIGIEENDKVRIRIPDVSELDNSTIDSLSTSAQLKFVDAMGTEILSGADIVNATAECGVADAMSKEEYYIVLEFSEEGRVKFSEATARVAALPIGQNYIAIMLGDNIISVPNVYQRIDTGNCTIAGCFAEESARDLASIIKSGGLPFELEVVEE